MTATPLTMLGTRVVFHCRFAASCKACALIDARGKNWTKETGWLDLNNLIPKHSGWVLTVPYDINVWGQVSGYGLINGEPHAFLLTPARRRTRRTDVLQR